MSSHMLLLLYSILNNFSNLNLVPFHVHEAVFADYVPIRKPDAIRLATSLVGEMDHAVFIGRVCTGFSCQAQIWYAGDLR